MGEVFRFFRLDATGEETEDYVEVDILQQSSRYHPQSNKYVWNILKLGIVREVFRCFGLNMMGDEDEDFVR